MLNRKNAVLVVMTALLSMALTQVMANEIGKSPNAGNSQNQVLPNDSVINFVRTYLENPRTLRLNKRKSRR